MKSLRAAPATALTSGLVMIDISRKRETQLKFETKSDPAVEMALISCHLFELHKVLELVFLLN